MSMDSLIFFLLVLAVWGLFAGAKWLQEQMDKHTTDGLEIEPIDWSAPSEIEAVHKPESSVFAIQPNQPRFAQPESGRRLRPANLRRRLGLGSRQNLRQGIILMTILGPCRGLEKPDDFIRLS